MPSGTRLTEQQVDRILKLAGLTDSNGEYRLSYADIAESVSLSERTVRRTVRWAAAQWGKHTAWKDAPL